MVLLYWSPRKMEHFVSNFLLLPFDIYSLYYYRIYLCHNNCLLQSVKKNGFGILINFLLKSIKPLSNQMVKFSCCVLTDILKAVFNVDVHLVKFISLKLLLQNIMLFEEYDTTI